VKIGHDGFEGIEPGVAQCDPLTERRKPFGSSSEGVKIPIDGHEGQVIPGLEDRSGVSAPADRGVDHHPRGDWPEEFDDELNEDGVVDEAFGHVAPS